MKPIHPIVGRFRQLQTIRRRALERYAAANSTSLANIRAELAEVPNGSACVSPTNPRKTTMTSDQIHEVAKMAAESAMHMNGMAFPNVTTVAPTPAEAAANVVDAYMAAAVKLSASSGTPEPQPAS